jgi:bifunctional DNA-binding transcriptional regulator/antitoxin component of YhaV-PrlF toxin-antitoxin module
MIIHMPFEPKIKLAKVGNSFRVTIPMDMIDDLGWKEKDILRIGLEGDRVTIRKDKN